MFEVQCVMMYAYDIRGIKNRGRSADARGGTEIFAPFCDAEICVCMGARLEG